MPLLVLVQVPAVSVIRVFGGAAFCSACLGCAAGAGFGASVVWVPDAPHATSMTGRMAMKTLRMTRLQCSYPSPQANAPSRDRFHAPLKCLNWQCAALRGPKHWRLAAEA